MVNFGLNSASLIGIFNIFLAIVYFAISIFLPAWKHKIIGAGGIVLYVLQMIIAPSILLLVGLILLFQGWRLDPILQFGVLLQSILIVLLGLKDIYIFDAISKNSTKNKR